MRRFRHLPRRPNDHCGRSWEKKKIVMTSGPTLLCSLRPEPRTPRHSVFVSEARLSVTTAILGEENSQVYLRHILVPTSRRIDQHFRDVNVGTWKLYGDGLGCQYRLFDLGADSQACTPSNWCACSTCLVFANSPTCKVWRAKLNCK